MCVSGCALGRRAGSHACSPAERRRQRARRAPPAQWAVGATACLPTAGAPGCEAGAVVGKVALYHGNASCERLGAGCTAAAVCAGWEWRSRGWGCSSLQQKACDSTHTQQSSSSLEDQGVRFEKHPRWQDMARGQPRCTQAEEQQPSPQRPGRRPCLGTGHHCTPSDASVCNKSAAMASFAALVPRWKLGRPQAVPSDCTRADGMSSGGGADTHGWLQCPEQPVECYERVCNGVRCCNALAAIRMVWSRRRRQWAAQERRQCPAPPPGPLIACTLAHDMLAEPG